MNEPKEKPAAKTAEAVYKEALKLSAKERGKLSCMLEQARDAGSGYATPEIEQAWQEEIARRVKLMGEGKMEFVDGAQFLNELRQKYAL